jgi:hypothetical protein
MNYCVINVRLKPIEMFFISYVNYYVITCDCYQILLEFNYNINFQTLIRLNKNVRP